jgi:hypothetical protein
VEASRKVYYTESGEYYKKKLPKKFRRISEDLAGLEKYLAQVPRLDFGDLCSKNREGLCVYKWRWGIATEGLDKRKGLRYYYAAHRKHLNIVVICSIYYKGDLPDSKEHLPQEEIREIIKSACDFFSKLA